MNNFRFIKMLSCAKFGFGYNIIKIHINTVGVMIRIDTVVTQRKIFLSDLTANYFPNRQLFA
jgi:hypothetical protein